MSYDYDALVSEITASRRLASEAEAALGGGNSSSDEQAAKELELLEHLSSSVDKFEVLSKHCPMTPLLWMQNALDTFELMKIIKKQENPNAFTTDDHSSLLELLDLRIQLLELALHEFPGSAILRLHHAEMVGLSTKLRTGYNEKYQHVLDEAIQSVARGSHRNESKLVVEFYTMQCDHVRDSGKDGVVIANRVSQLFLQRAETPMNEGINAGLGDQYTSYAKEWTQSSTVTEIERRRRLEAKYFGFLVTYEDDIDVALETESGVSNANGIEQWEAASTQTSEMETIKEGAWRILGKWKKLLNGDNGGCWMGLGGSQAANAFVQYAQACFRYRIRNQDGDETDKETQRLLQNRIQHMAMSVFERGIAECPTVDSLWLSYLRRLNYLVDQNSETNQHQEKMTLLTKASAVVDRAIRNCPYSTELVKVKLKIVLAMANAGMLVLDPEELLTKTIVKETLENGFVQEEDESNNPTVAVELFQILLSIVRNRILFVLAEAAQTKVTTKNGKENLTSTLKHDDPESIQSILNKSPPPDDGNSLGEDGIQELEDLCNDLREIYDEADSYLRKNHKKYRSNTSNVTVEEARAVLTKERAVVESHLVSPLLRAINDNDGTSEEEKSLGRERLAEVLQHHDRATKIWQPPHPGTYMEYIREIWAFSSVSFSTISAPTEVLRNIRVVRFLYQKAIKSVGNPKIKTKSSSEPGVPRSILSPDELDYETSLRCLCRDYLLFEKQFGSDHSYSECQKFVEKKLAKAYALATTTPVTATTGLPVNTNTTEVRNEEGDTPFPMVIDGNNDEPTIPQSPLQKRKRADEGETAEETVPPASKRAKEEAPEEPEEKEPTNKATNFKELAEQQGRKIHPKHKVKVGKIEHPAHPFTIKVSFLSLQTEDMDLVDALRPKCGPIVHAKIIRDKHSQKSKGWALVQFEERESVEVALGLSDVLGIKDKSVTIERSHLAAVGLIPPGMHRVNPKGEGRSSKRNSRNKKRLNEIRGPKPMDTSTSEFKPEASKPKKAPSSTASIFAFKPRGVGSQQRKAKISISSSDTKHDDGKELSKM